MPNAPGDPGVIDHDLIHGMVQHKGSSIDSTQTREALRKAAQAIQRIDVRGLAVLF